VLSGGPAGSLHAVGRPTRPLVTGVLRAGVDPARPAALWAFLGPPTAARLRVSEDEGRSWREAATLPPGTLIDAAAHPTTAEIWAALTSPAGGLALYRLAAGGWLPVARLPPAGGRILACGDEICFLDTAGRRLWRLAADGGREG
jgi:hypothetical protein